MERCPLCRATLNGSDTCRRCKSELGAVRRVSDEAKALLGEAMVRLSQDDLEDATRLTWQSLLLHETPQVRALWTIVRKLNEESLDAAARKADLVEAIPQSVAEDAKAEAEVVPMERKTANLQPWTECLHFGLTILAMLAFGYGAVKGWFANMPPKIAHALALWLR